MMQFTAAQLMIAGKRADNRSRRYRRKLAKEANYRANGLNGPRAVARRLRQIAAGQLQVTLEPPIARLTDEQCRAVRDYMVAP